MSESNSRHLSTLLLTCMIQAILNSHTLHMDLFKNVMPKKVFHFLLLKDCTSFKQKYLLF